MNIPSQLQPLADNRIWVCSTKIPSAGKHNGGADGKGGYDKPPVSVHTGITARVNMAEDLSTFAEAAGYVGTECTVKNKQGQAFKTTAAGVGISLQWTGYTVIDLDEVRNPKTGELTPEAADMVGLCIGCSYIEVSMSGKGLHILMKASVPEGQRKLMKGRRDFAGGDRAEYQLIDRAYVALTLNVLPESSPLTNGQQALDEVCWRYFRKEAPSVESSQSSSQAQTAPAFAQRQQSSAFSGDGTLSQSDKLSRWLSMVPQMSDEELKAGIFAAGSAGAKARDLFYGNWQGYGYPSQSEADLALMSLLMSFTQSRERTLSLFCKSSLFRKTKTPDYRSRTLDSVADASPMYGHIEFTREDRRAYAQAMNASEMDQPLAWDSMIAQEDRVAAEMAAGAPQGTPSVDSSGSSAAPQGTTSQAQSSASSGASVLSSVMATAQQMTSKPFDFEPYTGANLLSLFQRTDPERYRGYPLSLGMDSVNEALGGGLYPDFYVLGAVSSLGKTSLVLQWADWLAEHGTPVLYFALEMSARELIAKSVSRLMFLNAGIADGGDTPTPNREEMAARHSWTATEILYPAQRGKRTRYDCSEDLKKAIEQYQQGIGRNIRYFDEGRFTVDRVVNLAETYIAQTGIKPVVVIDYLQILAAPDPKWSDKQKADDAVYKLKDLSRQQALPVIAISSFNRESYTQAVTETAFKESGGVEYTAGGLIGLQPDGMSTATDKGALMSNLSLVMKTKGQKVRHLEAILLKNRQGLPESKCKLRYYAEFNLFMANKSAAYADDWAGVDAMSETPIPGTEHKGEAKKTKQTKTIDMMTGEEIDTDTDL